jgi:hypothetical protein
MKLRLAYGLLFIFGFGATLWADPPARVARLNYFSGSVSFRPGTLDDWAPATLNYPLTTGDHLWTDNDARSELHVGSAAFRLGPQTAFAILNLDDHTTQVRLSQGSLDVRVRHLEEDDAIEIDTPNSAVSVLRPGFYRIDVNANGDQSSVIVRQGEAEITAGGSAVPVRSSQEAFINGTDSPTYDVQDAAAQDNFDSWSIDRDRREDQVQSTRYISSEVVGYEDLDTNGRWRVVGDYGPVWTPATVEVGWAPYHNGHWAWVAPWGWTWVDDASWGFAPFHYGRWAYIEGNWGWCPGVGAAVIARPVYAPALVAFVGGNSWSASLSFGVGGGVGVAWFALGPREAYIPAYEVSPAYVQNINITHVTNITNITNINNQNVTYVNQSVPGAVIAVPQSAFVGAKPVAAVAVSVPPQALARATFVSKPASVQPLPVSVLGHPPTGLAQTPRPPATVQNRAVVAKLTPPAPPPKFTPNLVRATSVSQPGSNALVKSALETRGVLKPARPTLPPPRPITQGEAKLGPGHVKGLPAAQAGAGGAQNGGQKPENIRPQTGNPENKGLHEGGNTRPGSVNAPGGNKPENIKPPSHTNPENKGLHEGGNARPGSVNAPGGNKPENIKPPSHTNPENQGLREGGNAPGGNKPENVKPQSHPGEGNKEPGSVNGGNKPENIKPHNGGTGSQGNGAPPSTLKGSHEGGNKPREEPVKKVEPPPHPPKADSSKPKPKPTPTPKPENEHPRSR